MRCSLAFDGSLSARCLLGTLLDSTSGRLYSDLGTTPLIVHRFRMETLNKVSKPKCSRQDSEVETHLGVAHLVGGANS